MSAACLAKNDLGILFIAIGRFIISILTAIRRSSGIIFRLCGQRRPDAWNMRYRAWVWFPICYGINYASFCPYGGNLGVCVMSWPKMPDGTVDWMAVFQNPETGLVVMIEQADTSEKLRACFITVIDALFSRKNDADARQTYYDILADTIPQDADSEALGAEKIKLRLVMYRVMNDRITRSREYAARKAAEGAGQDNIRRGDDDSPRQ
jgi:hypothetical protein